MPKPEAQRWGPMCTNLHLEACPKWRHCAWYLNLQLVDNKELSYCENFHSPSYSFPAVANAVCAYLVLDQVNFRLKYCIWRSMVKTNNAPSRLQLHTPSPNAGRGISHQRLQERGLPEDERSDAAPGIIYRQRRRSCEEFAAALRDNGIGAKCYYVGWLVSRDRPFTFVHPTCL